MNAGSPSLLTLLPSVNRCDQEVEQFPLEESLSSLDSLDFPLEESLTQYPLQGDPSVGGSTTTRDKSNDWQLGTHIGMADDITLSLPDAIRHWDRPGNTSQYQFMLFTVFIVYVYQYFLLYF